MRARRLAAPAAVALLLAVGAFVAFGPDAKDATPGQNCAPAPGKITFITGFSTAYQHAGAWVAKHKGYYSARGLDVDIKPGQGTDFNLKLLGANQVQIAEVDTTGGFIEGSKPKIREEIDFRFIAALHQRTLIGIVTLDGTGITTPKDLEGKTIGTVPGGVAEKVFPGYAALAGVDAAKVKWVPIAPLQQSPLLAAGKVDALATFVVRAPDVEAAAKRKANTLPYSDQLGDLFGSGLVAKQSFIACHRDLVVKFREAYLAGHRDAVLNPQEAATLMARDVKTLNPAAAVAELAAMRGYVGVDGRDPLGSFERSRVARALALLKQLGLANVDDLDETQFVADFALVDPGPSSPR